MANNNTNFASVPSHSDKVERAYTRKCYSKNFNFILLLKRFITKILEYKAKELNMNALLCAP